MPSEPILRTSHKARGMALATGVVLGFAVFAAQAGDPEAGAGLVQSCVACHGDEGRSQIDRYPSLAGEDEEFLFEEMKAFRDGDRQDPEMTPQVARFDDQQLADIAAYFAAQDPE